MAVRYLSERAFALAVQNGHSHIAKVLVESDFILHSPSLKEPMSTLCAGGSVEVLKYFVERTKNRLESNDVKAGLESAVRNDKYQILHYWLEEYPDPNMVSIDASLAIEASGYGFADVLDILINKLRQGQCVEDLLSRCLMAASEHHQCDIIDRLMKQGADINGVVDGKSPLHVVFSKSNQYGKYEKVISNRHRKFGSQPDCILLLLRLGAIPTDKIEFLPSSARVRMWPTSLLTDKDRDQYINSFKEQKSLLGAAASIERGGLPIITALLELEAPSKREALEITLSFFGNNRRGGAIDGFSSKSVQEVMECGPGAVVKTLLIHLPQERADDSRYYLLAQMACIVGDRQCLSLLIERGMNVNGVGHYYGTVLQAASRFGSLRCAELLFYHGADVNIIQGEHSSALRAAVRGGHEDLVLILIARGAKLKLYIADKKPLIYLALESANITILKALYNAGIETEGKDQIQQHAILLACIEGLTPFVELLLASGANPNTMAIKSKLRWDDSEERRQSFNRATPLHAACANGNMPLARLLLARGADLERVDPHCATPLITAINKKQRAIVRLLLEKGANASHGADVFKASHVVALIAVYGRPDSRSDPIHITPLTEAGISSSFEIVRELLNAGARIGNKSSQRNELALACKNRQFEVVSLLLEYLVGAEDEIEICSEALDMAIRSSDNAIVSLLLDQGVFPSRNMIWSASSGGLLEPVRMLLDEGMDVDEKDENEATPLHLAASHTKPEMVQFLIDAGADVNHHSTKYGTPLVAALERAILPHLDMGERSDEFRKLAEQLGFRPHWDRSLTGTAWRHTVNQCEQIVTILLRAGSQFDTRIRPFGNALHLASRMGSEIIVNQILDKVHDVNTNGGYFGTPLIAAIKGGHEKIINMLLRWEIDLNYWSPGHGTALTRACAGGNVALVKILIDRGVDVDVNDGKNDSALAAASNYSYWDSSLSSEKDQILDLLLQHKSTVSITECDLLAASSWKHGGTSQKLIDRFLTYDESAQVTEEVIVEFIATQTRDPDVRVLQKLLDRRKDLGTTPAMLKAADNVAVMEFLTKNRPICQVTSDILERVSRQYEYADLFKLLLTPDADIPLSDTALIAASENTRSFGVSETALKLLLEYDRRRLITDEVLKAVVDPKALALLLERRQSSQTISAETLEKAASMRDYRRWELVSLFLKHDKTLKLTPTVVSAAVTSSNQASCLNTLFEHNPLLQLSEEDMVTLIASYVSPYNSDDLYEPEKEEVDSRKGIAESSLRQEGLVNLLLRYGQSIQFTSRIRKALDEKFPYESEKPMKEKFYRLERKHGTHAG